MNKSEIYEILRKVILSRHQAHIERSKFDSNAIDCIPLILGENLLLALDLYDFEPDGYLVIRLKDITSIRSGASERFSEYILQQEGIFNQIKQPKISNVDDWGNLLKNLKILGKNCIVECESVENGEFYIGKIVELDSKSVSLLNFNGVGEWDRKHTVIPFRNITSVSFDKRYITTISKYLKDPLANNNLVREE